MYDKIVIDGLSFGLPLFVMAIGGIYSERSGITNLALEGLQGAGAFVGALVGFLWYNAFPAQVFMGDTGSLTIGGIIAVSAIIIRKELLIPILCGVFFVESLSVIIQRFYYKAGKKKGVKQRFFKRTPIHDHFRTSVAQVQKMDPGCTIKVSRPEALLHEAKITVRFWIVTIILAALTIITLKIR